MSKTNVTQKPEGWIAENGGKYFHPQKGWLDEPYYFPTEDATRNALVADAAWAQSLSSAVHSALYK